MKKNLFSRTITILLTSMLLLAAFSLIVYQNMVKGIAYAASIEEIYYGDDGYAGGGEATLQTETFTYATQKVTASKLLNKSFPAYNNMNSALTNFCANVAGANIIGYYDRYYENLIPDCVPGVMRGTNYTYYPMANNSAKRQAVIDDLYVRMNTNVSGAGTTQAQYKNGLTSYVNAKGKSIFFSSVITNGRLDIAKLNQALNSGNPVSLYLSGYNITEIIDNNGTVTLAKSIYPNDHIMVVYGYQSVEYYGSNNKLVASKTYLYITSGIKSVTGYYVIENNGTINDAEAVSIS